MPQIAWSSLPKTGDVLFIEEPRAMANRTNAVVLVTALLIGGCSTALDVTAGDAEREPVVVVELATPTDRPEPAPSPTSDEAATSDPPPTPVAPAEPTTAPVTPVPEGDGGEDVQPTPSPTTAPTSTPTPTPTVTPFPTPEALEFVVAPGAALLGVPLGAEAEPALIALIAAMGDPDFDSGWYEGCPLDGDQLNERLVQWGDLNVYFLRTDDGDAMRAWGYDLRIVDGGFPGIDLIRLPGGARMGDPVNEVAAAAGLEVVYDSRFDLNTVGEPGYQILSDAPPGAPVWGAFVPAVPVCE